MVVFVLAQKSSSSCPQDCSSGNGGNSGSSCPSGQHLTGGICCPSGAQNDGSNNCCFPNASNSFCAQ